MAEMRRYQVGDSRSVALVLEGIAEARQWAMQAKTAGEGADRAYYRLLIHICGLTEEQADEIEPAFTELENVLFCRPRDL